MAVDQTDGEPPSLGSTILVNIGCTANSSSAETNSTPANSAAAMRESRAGAQARAGAVVSRSAHDGEGLRK